MTDKNMKLLDLLTDDYTKQLAQQCGVFVTIGTRDESPRWIIYDGSKNENDAGGLIKSLHFGHSQVNHIWFSLPLDKLSVQERSQLMAIPYEDITAFFRQVKYTYLAKFWPTIDIPEEYHIKKELPAPVVTELDGGPGNIQQERNDERSEYDIQAEEFLSKHGVRIAWSFDRFGKYFNDDKQSRNIFTWTLSREDKTISGSFGSSIVDSCKNSPAIDSPFECEIYWGIKVGEGGMAMYLSHTMNTTYDVLHKIDAGEIHASSIINKKLLAEKHAEFLDKRKKLAAKMRFKEAMNGDFMDLRKVTQLIVDKIKRVIYEATHEKKVLYGQADTIHEPSAYDLLSCLTKSDPGTFENFCGDFGYDTDSRKAEKVYNAVKKEWADMESFFSDTELDELQEIQ